MLSYFRYASFVACILASTACLALWARSLGHWDLLTGPHPTLRSSDLRLETFLGTAVVTQTPAIAISQPAPGVSPSWDYEASDEVERRGAQFRHVLHANGAFGAHEGGFYFPLWYPTLLFLIAGSAVTLLGRRFTLRSALIATTVVAGLLGMVVIL